MSSNDLKRTVLALTATAVMATMILGVVDRVTRKPIAEAQKATLLRKLAEVLPAHANDPLKDRKEIKAPWSEKPIMVFRARDEGGRIQGIAFEVVAPDGYAGSIRILLGILPDGRLNAIRVTQHRETPGLGDGIENDANWVASFVGKGLQNARWAVKKDGGDFDQFTGATISPRAVVRAVHRGLVFFERHKGELLDQKQRKAKALRP